MKKGKIYCTTHTYPSEESGYRLMWMMVMFDLPVVEFEDRKKATKFRDFLEKQGFGMCQFSVYARFCGSREKTDALYRKIMDNVPPKGKVSIINFTDKQFGSILHYHNNKRQNCKETPEQLLIFDEND